MTDLTIWMNGVRVGTWSRTRSGQTLQYDPGWITSSVGCVLSLSLPFTPGNAPRQGDAVENYFDNLLPDSEVLRERLQARFGTASTKPFDLLAAVGRDCIGAIQILPESETPVGFDLMESEPLTDAGVQQLIDASLSKTPPSETSDFRISLAGAQAKTALLFYRGKWRRPLRATPTTHILKLPMGFVGTSQLDMRESVENEWLCSRLMTEFGLPTATCEIAQFGSWKVLVVERFDRGPVTDGWIARRPQEDCCQALGLPSEKKYESDGGPGIRDILRILESSTAANADRRAFVKAQIVFWLLAATDGHAKNFSLFHHPEGKYRLTPFYDVLSTWPIMGRRHNQISWHKAQLAMAIRSKNVHWKLCEIKRRHWDGMAALAGLGEATSLLQEVVTQTPRAIENVNRQLPVKFPPAIADTIFEGMRRAVVDLR